MKGYLTLMNSEGVEMMVLKYCLLLSLFNIPTTVHAESECDVEFLVRRRAHVYRCVEGNVTINAVHDILSSKTYFTFECKETNLTYLKPPEHRPQQHEVYLLLSSCSPSNIIGFVNEIFDKPTIDHAQIQVTSKILPTTDMESLKTMVLLFLTLEGDTIIPINGTSLWSSLAELKLVGGHYLQLTEDPEANLTRLPANSFSGLKSLMEFDIHNNKNIEIIEADAFRGLNELQKLRIIHGNLKHLEVGAFAGIPILRILDLSNNFIESLPNGLFQSLEYIAEIFLHGNHLKVIDSHAFAQIPTLKLIDMSYCAITGLPENVFTGSDNIQILKVQMNLMESLPSKIFRDQHYLKTLYLGNNKMKDPRKFNVFNNLKTLEYLDLSNNQISILPKSLFLELINLEEINLSNNYIKSITKELVRDTRDIELSYDKIDTLSSKGNPFKFLTKLRRLNLAGNQIKMTSFDQSDDMLSLLRLERLNLSRNQITYDILGITRKNFTNLQITIDLSFNKISSLYYSKYVSDRNNERVANSAIILTGNPINCDCYSYGLYLRLNGAYKPEEPKYIFDSDCFSPSNLKGIRLKDISPKLLICDHTDDNCLKTCSRCIVVESELIVDCQELPSQQSIYDLTNNPSVESRTANMKNQPNSLENLNINKLNLTNAGIKRLTFIPNHNLKILDVSHNNMSTVPDIFSKANYTLYLSNNPFECECEFLKDIFSLHIRGLVPDYNETTCANGEKVAQIDINELCTRSIRLISLIGCSTIGSFIAFVTVIKLYLNAHNIWMNFLKIFCKRKYEKTRIEMREVGIETAKVYDLFISYAHQDEIFVAETLLPKLENEFKQRVCVHTRDWVVGNVIANQIIESVENSRRTVIILSEHFLMSEWSEVEFHTAHNWSIQEGKPRIIIILLKEEVARDERMGAELKSYIASNTYLLWDDPLFWEKLQKVLPGKIPKHIW